MLHSVNILLAPLLFACFLTIPTTAQRYITAGGVRFEPDRLGFTVQQRVLQNTTVEAIAVGSALEVSGHLLGEQHFPVLGQRLNIYVGGGFHVGDHKEQGFYYGPDVITGIEYKVNALPFLLSFDFKPSVHLGYEDRLTPSTAFSLRYVFVKDKKPVFGFLKRWFQKDGPKEK